MNHFLKTLSGFFAALSLSFIVASCAASAPMRLDAMNSEKAEAMEDKMFESPSQAAPRPESSPSQSSAKKLKADAGPEAMTQAAKRLSESDDLSIKEPELLSFVDGPDLEKIPLAALDGTVIVTETSVRVVFDMIFENPHDRVLSGTLMMTLPKGASPSYLGMFSGSGPDVPSESLLPKKPIDPLALLGKYMDLGKDGFEQGGNASFGKIQEARVVDPVKGRETYEQVTRARVDPALSEWSGGSSFSTKVYPIPAKSRKRVIFSYDRPLPYENGIAILPLPVPKTVTAAAMRLTVHVLSQNLGNRAVTAAGNAVKPGQDGSFTFNLDKKWKGSALLTARPENPEMAAIAGTSDELNATLARVRLVPGIKAETGASDTGKAVFLLDTSYSTRPKVSGMELKLLRATLENDPSISEFSVIAFDVRARDLTGGFVRNEKQTRDALFDKLSSVWLEGATDFRSVLSFLSERGYAASAGTMFLLSDGQITWSTESVPLMRKKFPEAFGKRWICYGFGEEAVNTPLFNELTASGGMTVQVNLSDDIIAAATAHRTEPLSIDSVSGSLQEDIIVSGGQKTLGPGQSIELAIKAKKGQKSSEITVTLSGTKRKYSVPLTVDPRISFLACRAWADVYATRLLDFEDKEADRASLALSQAFSLSNRAASFLILENDAEYKTYRIEPEWLSWRDVTKGLAGKLSGGARDGLETSELAPTAVSFAQSLKTMQKGNYWAVGTRAETSEPEGFLFSAPPEKRANDWPVSIYRQALAMKESRASDGGARAFRTITTIAETKSRDDVALRVAGFTLFSWGFYGDAGELFARIRERRPFEAQGYLLEAAALQASGKYDEAAIRYEIVLARPWQRLDGYSKTVAKYLYADLLSDVIRQKPDKATIDTARKRLSDLGPTDRGNGRIILFWNLDNTDVDLHVLEPSGFEVNYSKKNSPSGGILYWDNTEGLGPELYEHPAPKGFGVSVNYFGSSSVEGSPPSSTFVLSFLRDSRSENWKTDFYTTILEKPASGKIEIVPGKWGGK